MAKKKPKADVHDATISKTPISGEPEPSQIRFDYIKSNFFRVIRADGAYGGLTPRGNAIHIAFFSERSAIPLQDTFDREPGGGLGKLTDRTVRQAVIREVEVDVMLDLDTARSVSQWLQERIRVAEELLGNAKEPS
jgi:hypothetical protein